MKPVVNMQHSEKIDQPRDLPLSPSSVIEKSQGLIKEVWRLFGWKFGK
ncbi:TPA: hypothetical protein HA249_03275 [Candidatus Woesearchaeota archaeon]|nr:hypothetical protein [Candidatus Woesearchaeota archaeon]HIH47450.1 hypothetical protein [Candidatus Woesearchaeota archaeon]HII88847.1 hypothetical protein [Candidatus Woesearchaeota archaeon]